MLKETTTYFGVGKQTILESFLPDKKFKLVLNIQIFLIYFLIFWGAYISFYFGGIAAVFEGPYTWASWALFLFYIILGISFPIYLIIVICIIPYYRSINYSFTTQEIIVNIGFINKKTKIVPYRNITNFVMKRGLLYRLVGGENFGVILIETAGQGPQQKHPEQRLVGVTNVAEYSQKIQDILSKMKGQAGLSSDTETSSSMDEEVILTQILTTLKQIERKL